MRCLLVLLVVCAVAFAEGPGEIERLVADEVLALLKATPGLTVDACTAKCDAVFDTASEETRTDRDCGFECRMQIEGPPSGMPPSGEPPRDGPGDR